MTVLEQISHETMVFMRGRYCLDEIGDGKNELKFRQGKKTIVTVYLYEDKFTFLVILGKKERESFEMQRSEFTPYIHDYYDHARTYHDGKWMYIDVNTLEQLEEIKKLIRIKKKPNRKPFPKENALYSKCGQRCDLCVHYIHTNEELRAEMEVHLSKMWEQTDWSMRCECILSWSVLGVDPETGYAEVLACLEQQTPPVASILPRAALCVYGIIPLFCGALPGNSGSARKGSRNAALPNSAALPLSS